MAATAKAEGMRVLKRGSNASEWDTLRAIVQLAQCLSLDLCYFVISF